MWSILVQGVGRVQGRRQDFFSGCAGPSMDHFGVCRPFIFSRCAGFSMDRFGQMDHFGVCSCTICTAVAPPLTILYKLQLQKNQQWILLCFTFLSLPRYPITPTLDNFLHLQEIPKNTLVLIINLLICCNCASSNVELYKKQGKSVRYIIIIMTFDREYLLESQRRNSYETFAFYIHRIWVKFASILVHSAYIVL